MSLAISPIFTSTSVRAVMAVTAAIAPAEVPDTQGYKVLGRRGIGNCFTLRFCYHKKEKTIWAYFPAGVHLVVEYLRSKCFEAADYSQVVDAEEATASKGKIHVGTSSPQGSILGTENTTYVPWINTQGIGWLT